MAFVILTHHQQDAYVLEPPGVGILKMVKVFFPRKAGPLDVLLEYPGGRIVLVVAQARLHL